MEIDFRISQRKKLRTTLAPLIDMVFLLLVFFMLTTQFAKELTISIALPSEYGAVETQTGQNVVITLINDANVLLNDREVAITKLTELLPKTPETIQLKISKEVSLQTLTTVMQYLEQSAKHTITFQSIKENADV